MREEKAMATKKEKGPVVEKKNFLIEVDDKYKLLSSLSVHEKEE